MGQIGNKKKIARDPPRQSLFLRRTSIAQSRRFQQVLGGLGRTSGGLGDALGETWAKLAKRKNRGGLPYTMSFLRRKSSAESPGSSSQLRKRASWILHPSHTTPACKTRPNPDLKPQTSNPKSPTSNLTLKIPTSTPSHVFKSQTAKSQTSNLISQTSTLKPRVGVGGMSRRR